VRQGPKEPILIAKMLALAEGVAEVATYERASVGCVLTTPDLAQVLAYGYNGPASGLPNQCARPHEVGNCGCVHAEQNACIKAGPGPKWAFISCHPCERCAAAMVNAGVEVVFYTGDSHREVSEGMALLDRVGIPHGTPDELLAMMTELTEHTSSLLASAFAEEWDDDDIAAAKAQASRFAD